MNSPVKFDQPEPGAHNPLWAPARASKEDEERTTGDHGESKLTAFPTCKTG